MQEKIEALTSKIKLSRLKELVAELSERYRTGKIPFLQTEEHRLAYLVTRFPATCAAIETALKEIESFPITTLLDLGAGPGTGWTAAKQIFSDLREGTCVEADASFIKLGKSLIEDKVVWQQKDLKACSSFPEHDLVLMSYSMGEIPERFWAALLDAAWEATKQALVIIEPGTPVGFERIRKLRTYLLEKKGHLYAPCPHMEGCPMTGSDWCHFAARVTRSSLHRQAKEGSLGFEDEKFSYLIFGKKPRALPAARILRYPLKQKGHVSFALCAREGLKTKVVTKSDKEFYKKSKKLTWGSKLTDNDI